MELQAFTQITFDQLGNSPLFSGLDRHHEGGCTAEIPEVFGMGPPDIGFLRKETDVARIDIKAGGSHDGAENHDHGT